MNHARGNFWCLLVAAAGNRGAVDRTLREMADVCTGERAAMASLTAEQAHAAWQNVRDLGISSADGNSFTVRGALLPSQVAPFLESTESMASARNLSPRIDARPALGLVHVQIADNEQGPSLVSALRDLAMALGGRLVVEACSASLKPQVDIWGDSRPDATLMIRVKNALDARRTMSPGRFLGGL